MKFATKLISAVMVMVMLSLSASAAGPAVAYDEIANYYGEMSTDINESAYNAILAAARAHKDSVSLDRYNISTDQIKALYLSITMDNPDLFYLSSAFSYSYYGSKVYTLSLKYTMSVKEIDAAVDEFNSMVSSIVSTVPEGLGDLEKVLYIHDYLASHYEYDTSYTIYDAYNMLKSGSGVCQAYTELFIVLMDKLGVASSWASSDLGNHTWNVVCLNGEWYHVDVTHDDPTSDRFGMAQHEFFLLSDATRSKKFSDMVCSFSCNDASYEGAAWLDTSSPLAYSNGKWYGIYSDGIYEVDVNSGSMSLVHSEKNIWHVWGSSTRFYTNIYSSLISLDGVLYYNTADEIRSFDPSTGSSATVCTADTSSGYIYGMIYSGDRVLTYNIGTTPTEKLMQCTYTVPVSVTTGDLNDDGKMNSKDILIIKRAISGYLLLSDSQLLAADVNHDGKTNSLDVLLMKRASAGLIVLSAA